LNLVDWKKKIKRKNEENKENKDKIIIKLWYCIVPLEKVEKFEEKILNIKNNNNSAVGHFVQRTSFSSLFSLTFKIKFNDLGLEFYNHYILQPAVVNLWYLKIRSFYLIEFIVWNNYGPPHWDAKIKAFGKNSFAKKSK